MAFQYGAALNPDTWDKVGRYATIFSTPRFSESFPSLDRNSTLKIDTWNVEWNSDKTNRLLEMMARMNDYDDDGVDDDDGEDYDNDISTNKNDSRVGKKWSEISGDHPVFTNVAQTGWDDAPN